MARLNGGFAGAEDGVRFRYPRRLARALAETPGVAPIQIVDVGSAAGTTSVWLARQDRRFHVLGIDQHAELVAYASDIARAGGLPARFVVSDARAGLPVGDASADGVVLHRVRDSFVTRDERLALIREVHRALRPSGWLSFLEDARVSERDRHGAWYARRYAIHRLALLRLIEMAEPGFEIYRPWLDEPEVALLMSLRARDGTKVDDVAYESREDDLAVDVRDGRVEVRGVGIHETSQRLRADLTGVGFVVQRSWRVAIPEPPPRAGHATVMRGFLLRASARGS